VLSLGPLTYPIEYAYLFVKRIQIYEHSLAIGELRNRQEEWHEIKRLVLPFFGCTLHDNEQLLENLEKEI
jgi:hypothetical protein